VSGDYAYTAMYSGGLRVLNVSDASAPFEVGHVTLEAADGDRVALVAGDAGLLALVLLGADAPTDRR